MPPGLRYQATVPWHCRIMHSMHDTVYYLTTYYVTAVATVLRPVTCAVQVIC
jgi:hypothetical protein